MKPILVALTLASALTLLPTVVAAGVLTVGAGQAFADLQPAVDAAADGDLLLLSSGTYGDVTIDGKSLTVLADTGADARVEGTVVVRALAAHQAVVFAHLDVEAQPGNVAAVLLEDNAGSVRFESCSVGVRPVPEAQGVAPMVVTSCADVVLRETPVSGSAFTGVAPAALARDGATALRVEDSHVVLYGCLVRGAEGLTPDGPGTGGHGGSGLLQVDSVFISRSCDFVGADGGDAGPCAPGTAHLNAGGDGGDGAATLGSPSDHLFMGNASYERGEGGADHVGPDCPAGGQPGQPGVTQLAPPGSIDSLSGSSASIVVPQPVREQEAVEIVATGPSGNPFWLIYSPAHGSEVFPSYGPLHVAADFRMLFLGTLPVSGGALSVPVTVGELAPGVDHVRLFVQPLTLSSSAVLGLGTPLTLVLVDEAF